MRRAAAPRPFGKLTDDQGGSLKSALANYKPQAAEAVEAHKALVAALDA